MELTFLGATGTVTGSKYLLRAGSHRLLVDCGLFQGLKQLRLKNWQPLPVNPSEIDAVVLTHAHIDHSGYLPLLVRNGFRGPIFCTEGTRELCELLLPDSGRLQEEEAAYANRHGHSRHDPALPLYTEQDAARALERFVPVAFDQETEAFAGVSFRLRPAGHIVGAAMALVQGEGTLVLFSGDLGRPNDPVMKPPVPVAAADYLVLESTYGDRLHSKDDPAATLAALINRTTKRGGAVIVPAFAVGRAQMLLYLLYRLKRDGAIPDIPIFLNSPMAVDATRIFHAHHGEHRLSREECTAMFKQVQYVNTVEESKALNSRRGPMVVISASGMATGGRVLHHIRAFGPDARNMILFAGYQSAGTRGAALVQGADSVKMHGEYIPIRAEVAQLDNLSAHADSEEILDWLANFTAPPATTFLTHGEPSAADALRRRIKDRLGWNCHVPEFAEKAELHVRGKGK